MPPSKPLTSLRTAADLDRAVRAIGYHFGTDTVFVIGSQAVLLDHPDAPAVMRTSGEIGAYPGNAADWEAARPDSLASEEINALFGEGSRFHETHGFYIDGVDEHTAKFPPDWRDRAIIRTIRDGARKIRVIAPGLYDLIVSKLHRLDPKDKDFIRACRGLQPLDVARIRHLLAETEPDPSILTNAHWFLEALE